MKKITSLLLHRTALVAFLLLLQLGLLAAAVIRFSEYFIYLYFICVAISVLEVLFIINKWDDPGYKIAWVSVILLAPLFGGLFYFLCGGNGINRKTREKLEIMDRRMEEALGQDRKAGALESYGKDAVNQSRYLEENARCPLYNRTYTHYYTLGDSVFKPLLEELRKAERYIFLEYFIITPGKFWDAVLEVLREKVAQGVEVRVIYDDVGSLYTLPAHYDRALESYGIQCQVFNRFRPVLSLRLNNRDHRKICVIDGHTAFTGGFNLADEYINAKVRYGHWKDCGILLKGEGAWSMAVLFLAMWEYISGSRPNFAKYRPISLPAEAGLGTGWVQPYADSPLDTEPVGETVYLNLISKARDYVYIMTPYLIISDSINTALQAAAKSGLDVRIMVPHVPDKKTVFEVTRAHYVPLLEAGVKIYEYLPGFLHSKCFAVDDRYATVGSVNLDYRSMFLQFECGVWLCGDPIVGDVKEDFLATQDQCEEITLEKARKHSFARMLLRAVLRVFAPLM